MADQQLQQIVDECLAILFLCVCMCGWVGECMGACMHSCVCTCRGGWVCVRVHACVCACVCIITFKFVATES